jgi:TP901 family phage tail tape measure protein
VAEQIASLFVAIGANLAGLNQGLMQAQSKMKSVGQRMGQIGRGLTAAVTLPIIGIGVAAIKMAANFEQQMGLAQLALRDTGVSMETVSDYALKMGADTIYNAQEMATAITGLGKAGLDWEEIAGDMSGTTGVLTAVTSLAAASDLELAEAADVVSIAMATFNRPAEHAVDIVNSLVQAADASVAEVGDLAEALASAGPVMAGFGYDLEHVNIAIAILSEGGQLGSRAGTGLRSMFNNLMRPTKKVKDALGLLNINLYHSWGALKEMPILIDELSKALTIGATSTGKMSSMTGAQEKELKRLQRRHDSIRNSISDYQMGLKGVSWSEEKRREKVAELQGQLVNLEHAMGPLIASSQEYTTVTKEMTEELRNELVVTLAGTYGQVAMNTLLKGGIESWDEMRDKVENAATAEEVASVFTESLLGKLEELQGSVETVAIKFGGTFSPILKELVEDRLIPLVDVLGELDEEQMLGLAKLGLTIAGIGPGLIILSKLPAFLGALASPIGVLALGATILGGALYLSSEGGEDLRTSLHDLADEFSKEEGLTGLGEWIEKIADFTDKLAGVGQWLKDATQWGKDFFGVWDRPGVKKVSGFGAAGKKDAPTWEQYGEVGQGAWDKIKTDIATGLEFLMDVGATLIPLDLGLTEEAVPDMVEQLGVVEEILTEKPIELGLTLQPDMGQIEASGREAGGRWKRAFDSATGGVTGGGVGEGIMDDLWAGGVAW